MTEKARLALEEWRNENSRRSFGNSFYLLKHRAISSHNGAWVVQEFDPTMSPGQMRDAKHDHRDPWVNVSPRLTKDAAATILATKI